jgi:hypothetical protein
MSSSSISATARTLRPPRGFVKDARLAARRRRGSLRAMQTAPRPPTVVPAYVRPARLLLYVLLLAAAVVSVFGLPALEQAVREGRRSPAVLVVAPALLAVFIVAFAAYRFALVRARRYGAGKALVQVALMALALSLVLPGSLDRYRTAAIVSPVDLARPLRAGDAEVRAMAAELVRHRDREEALRHAPRLVDLLADGSSEVRRQARASLVALAGEDVGGEGPDAQARWRAHWQRQGVGASRWRPAPRDD